MKLRDDDLHIWTVVASTVRPLAGRALPTAPAPDVAAKAVANHAPVIRPPAATKTSSLRRVPGVPPQAIERGRLRRLVLGREPIGGRIDLHGLDQARARAALADFVVAAAARGDRGVLVITGKGALGDGVLRRQVPEWLAQAPMRALVAGLSEAHRRHGGAGALYVALKRRW